MSTYRQILDARNPKIVKGLINLLNTKGIYIDHDFSFLTREGFHEGANDLIEFLEHKGYVGEKLDTIGKYYSSHGAIYAIYDTTLFSSKEVLNTLRNNTRFLRNTFTISFGRATVGLAIRSKSDHTQTTHFGDYYFNKKIHKKGLISLNSKW